jgi:biopolymer transport protein ExbD
MSEINMTPLVDVMLVLVVIFIITAPLLASSIRLDLPATTPPNASEAPKFVLVVVDKAGQAYLDDKPVTLRAGRQAGANRQPTPTPKCSCAPTRPCPTAAWSRSWAPRKKPG